MQPNNPMTDELLAEIKAQYLVAGAELRCQCQGCMVFVISALVAELERLRAALKLGYLSRESLRVIYQRFADDQTVDRKQLEWVLLKLRAMCSEPPRQPQASDDQRERGGGE